MSVDLSDPAINPAYAAILRDKDPTNWLILSYGETRDKLSLYATGIGGIEELRQHLGDDVLFAFAREDKSFAIINYFPAAISGVRRARALVHSRAVTTLFKTAQTTMTVTSKDQVGTNQVRAKLGLLPIEGVTRGFLSNGPNLVNDVHNGITYNPPAPLSKDGHMPIRELRDPARNNTSPSSMMPTPPPSSGGDSRIPRMGVGIRPPPKSNTLPSRPSEGRAQSPQLQYGAGEPSFRRELPLPPAPTPPGKDSAGPSTPDREYTNGNGNGMNGLNGRGVPKPPPSGLPPPPPAPQHSPPPPPPPAPIAAVSSAAAAEIPSYMRARATSAAATDYSSDYPETQPRASTSSSARDQSFSAPFINSRMRGMSTTSSAQDSELGYRRDGGSEREQPTPPLTGSNTQIHNLLRTEAQNQVSSMRAKWAAEEQAEAGNTGYTSSASASARRRGKTKSQILRERAREEQEMAIAAAEAAARRKWEKEEEARREMEEEERKKAEFEEAQRRRAADRLRREQLRREEEERERIALEERRAAARARRIEESQRAAQRRAEEEQRQRERAEREEQRIKDAKDARDKQMKEIQGRFEVLRMTGEVLLTGYISVQVADSVVWRRRYFMLRGDRITFHRNEHETHKLLDTLVLRDRIKGVKEWHEGYDDLRVIPHSFAVEFTDDEGPWSFFADSEDDKNVFISLLVQVSK